MTDIGELRPFFSPKSVAVIGVGREPDGVGRSVYRNLLAAGFSGPVMPVNPKASELDGRPCYPSVSALPEVPELAVVAVPAAAVAGVIDELGSAGTRCAIVISAGFKETGPAGAALEREVLAVCARHGIRLLGPNCLGLISTGADLNASFAPIMPAKGGISFMSQSGALGTAALDWARGRRIGFSSFVSLGNRADLSESELLDVWYADDGTTVVTAYLEAVSDGARFVESATRFTASKPIVVLKSGGSDAGARAVSSHTGSLSGSDTAYDAAFAKAGIIRASGVQELFDLSEAFGRQPLPVGPGLAILTNAGGPAIMATDACEQRGVALASLGRETIERLTASLPPAAAVYNPIDVLGDAPDDRYAAALDALADDPGVRSLLVMLTPQAPTKAAETARAVLHTASRTGITTVACFMGDASVREARAILADGGVPCYPFPERAVSALAAMERYRAIRGRPVQSAPLLEADRALVQERLDQAKEARRAFITEQDAADILRAYDIAVPAAGLARDLREALALAEQIGYPVALKIASPDILHKSDIGGICLAIKDASALATAYERVVDAGRERMPEAMVWGVTVQAMVPAGREVIIGINRDPQFGPLLMFGLGGVYVEVMKDVTFRLCPVTIEEARAMVSEVRSYGLLRGARGQSPADMDAIVDTLVKVSALATDFPQIVELDINPLIVMDRGGGSQAADVRIGIGG